MSSATLNLVRVTRALAFVIYLGFPTFMGAREGFIDGFLPALLWPMPVVAGIIGLGSIPVWAGSLLGDRGFVAVWIAQAALVIAVGVVCRGERRRAKRVMGTAWAIIASMNILLWIGLGPYPD